MDYNVAYTLLCLISCVILPMNGKSMDEVNTSVETVTSLPSMEVDDVGTTDEYGGDEALLDSKERINAEFLTFSAPEEDDIGDEEEIEDLLELLKPKRILLIEAPENTTIVGFNADAEERNGLAEALLFGENSSTESVKKSENITTDEV